MSWWIHISSKDEIVQNKLGHSCEKGTAVFSKNTGSLLFLSTLLSLFSLWLWALRLTGYLCLCSGGDTMCGEPRGT